jgi:NAD(P)H-hydrate epimerase
MKTRPLRREEVREVDRIAIEEYGIAGIVLMENAGRDAAAWITSRFLPGEVCILCGKGNNAGDGYVIARHIETAEPACDESPESTTLGRNSWRVRIVSIVDCGELSGDAATNHAIADRAGIPIVIARDAKTLEELVGNPDVLVDCMLGTGATGSPRGLYADAVRLANRLATNRIAIDVPTGLDCDTGIAADPTFIASATLTFVAPKVGFSQPSAEFFLGQVVPVAIGVPKKLLSRYQAES